MKPEGLREIRHDMKLTQEELAAVLGVSSRQVQRWEGGTTRISKTVRMAVELLRVKLEVTP